MEYSAFEKLLLAKGATTYRVSKATGISYSTFADWKSGRSTPKADKLARIADFFGVSLDSMLGTQAGKTEEERVIHSIRTSRQVPIIGEIRAGSPIITDEALIGYEFADVEDVDEYFFLRIRGDSMKNCGMIEGSTVLFHKQQYAENGDIVACLVGGDSATVKRFRKENHKIVLSPENEQYQPILLAPEDFETGEARILGVAVEVKIKL